MLTSSPTPTLTEGGTEARYPVAVQDIRVTFGGVKALRGVSCEVVEGQVLGLIGPNGAGKTTLTNVITGFQEPDEGSVWSYGRELTGATPEAVAQAGIARTYQRVRLFGDMTPWDTVRLALDAGRNEERGWARAFLRVGRGDADAEVASLLSLAGLAPELWHRPSNALPLADQRRTEVARGLGTQPSLIIFDEPTSGMGQSETDQISSLIGGLPAHGLSVLLIAHDVDLVMTVSDWVVVLNFGEVLAAGPPEEIRGSREVREAYLGSDDA